MWHVLEHVHQLNETLEWLYKHLRSDGRLFIAVPNPESKDAQKFKQHWAAYDVPRHLYHFTKKAMRQLLEKHNFKVEEIKPMWFDSYYVSLLSTKYKAGQSAPLKSFFAGSLSNWSHLYNLESLKTIVYLALNTERLY
jgi:2-polyprenyl-3-methyl-5-hydroxy-6-metoxy-1,4-benzoquinol methylase